MPIEKKVTNRAGDVIHLPRGSSVCLARFHVKIAAQIARRVLPDGRIQKRVKMKAIVNSVKGTRDFYPEEMARRSWLYQQIRTVSEQFGYLEYDGPFLEKIDLYAAKSGEELVKKQAFVFPDRGGELIALRPELTPSLARMVAQKQNELVYPLRWWSFGPFWRYEQPGKGRSREFFQWNIDLIGTNSPEADAELLAVGAELLRAVGLRPDQVKIYVNNRRLINHKLAEVGITGDLAQTALGVIDRQGKMKAAEWDNYVLEQGLSAENLAALKEILANRELWRESDELRRLFGALDALGVSEYVEFDPHIIRGLLYYTGTVFEAFDVNHEFRAVFGGGRYDNLVGAVGGDPLPGVGFAMGDMIILLLLEKFGCLPAGPAEPAPVLRVR